MNAETKKPDGGPAFPVHDIVRHAPYTGGISVRDYFAAQAMQVEITTACHSMKNAQALVGAAKEARRTIEQQIAHNAYSMADAMLAERGKP